MALLLVDEPQDRPSRVVRIKACIDFTVIYPERFCLIAELRHLGGLQLATVVRDHNTRSPTSAVAQS